MATLVVNRSDSYCQECRDKGLRAGTSPWAKSHDLIYEYSNRSGEDPGCGAVYDSIRSDYFGLNMDQWAAKNRPDLEWVGIDETPWRN